MTGHDPLQPSAGTAATDGVLVTVCPDNSGAGHRAIRWAIAEAHRRDATLQVVLGTGGTGGTPDKTMIGRVLNAARRVAPGLQVLPHEADAGAATVRELSARSAVVVVPSTQPDLHVAVRECCCPLVVVPDTPRPRADRRPVVLAAAPWTQECVFQLAFDEAERGHRPLLAVRVWNDPLIDLGVPLRSRLQRWDAAEDEQRSDLEIALTAWRIAYPDVEVTTEVVEDRPAEFLVAQSYGAELVVLGRSERGTLLAAVAGSPVDQLITRGGCPVVVVPPDGLPHSGWFPDRSHISGAASL